MRPQCFEEKIKNTCTGCSACAAVCPSGCITMRADSEGFAYPAIDLAACRGCGLCARVCPINLRAAPDKQSFATGAYKLPEVYAAWNLDDRIRSESSSGGMFSLFAEKILAQGGIIGGAAYDEKCVVRHTLIQSRDELHRLRGSKYVQSEVSSDLYHQVHELLKVGRKVLFTGTPCQVAGLRSFLSRPFENLFCCDLICHGVPSPLLFSRYIQHCFSANNPLVDLSFRDKKTGWERFGIRRFYRNGRQEFLSMWSDPYMTAFLRDYGLRPSCYSCRFARVNREGDLTIADFWNVKNNYPEYDPDDKGTSLVLVNTEKGKALFEICAAEMFSGSADLATAMSGNPMLSRPSSRPVQRDLFYVDLEELSFRSFLKKYGLERPSVLRRILYRFKKQLISGIQRKRSE